jgi:phosphotransferase system  glucose/maltose/N-acetylglucosamine-specific IIC component
VDDVLDTASKGTFNNTFLIYQMATAEAEDSIHPSSSVATALLQVLDWVLKPITGLICLLSIVVLPFDAIDFYADPDEYVRAQHLDTSQPHWKWLYLQGDFILFALALFGAFLAIASIVRRRNRKLIITSRIFTIVAALVMGIGFYQWAMTGFDH